MEELAEDFHGPLAMALHGLTAAPFWLALAGVVAAWYMYLVNPALPAAIKRAFGPIYRLLDNKYYMDWFNEHVHRARARARSAPACGRAATRASSTAPSSTARGSWSAASPASCAGCSPATSTTTPSRCSWACSS